MPDSAAVDLAVTQAKSDPRTARFAGLVNGVLRGLARDKDARCRPSSPRATTPRTGSAIAGAAYGEDKARAILPRTGSKRRSISP